MAAPNQVTLLSFLQNGLPAIPISPPPNPSPKTRSARYSHLDITSTGVWAGFNLATLMHRYQHVLHNARLTPPAPTSPPARSVNEGAIKATMTRSVFHLVRAALRAGFTHMGAASMQQRNLIHVTFDVGERAEMINSYQPDTSYYEVILGQQMSMPNRAPGDVISSWKWSSAMAQHLLPGQRKEYRQALSQVNFYMKQHTARYGFILTDIELVVFRRLDDQGNLELAPSIPYTEEGTAAAPQMTVLLALWFLGMMAADNSAATGWTM